MSMPTWLNDVQALPSTENGAFASTADSSTAFMQAPITGSFDFNQVQSHQLQERLQNGNARNGSPAFNSPIYQTQPVVPSKRPRPREDSLGASPRQNPTNLPGSRSQTPQLPPYPGFQGTVNGRHQFQTPTPFQHLQHAGTSASISPVIQNQTFTPQSGAQRMPTTSPSPFSSTIQTFASQASPSHSEHGSRVTTPQNGGQPYTQNLPYTGGSNQPFTPPVGPNSTGATSLQYNHNPQTLERQRMYEMRMRQIQANNAAVPNRNQVGAPIPAPSSSTPMSAAYQMGLARQQQTQHSARNINPDQFARGIAQWMQQRNMTLDIHPTVTGRPFHVLHLFTTVIRLGGSKTVTEASQWTDIAKLLHVPQAQLSTAAHELQNYWHVNLSAYETFWQQNQRQRIMSERVRSSQNVQSGDMSNIQGQFSPVRQAESQISEQQRQPMLHAPSQLPSEFHTPPKPVNPHAQDAFQFKQNGYPPPQGGQFPSGQSNKFSLSQPGANVPIYRRTQSSGVRTGLNSIKKEFPRHSDNAVEMPRIAPLPEMYKPLAEPLEKRKGLSQAHGGIQALDWAPVVDELLEAKPNVPAIHELGVIDVRALTMSLRSGIHAEVRLALDTLAALSNRMDSPTLDLEDCEDLIEVLIECAEDQVEVLAEDAAEVSDAMLISSYEEIVRGCRVEVNSLQEVHEFGTLECELDRSVERLICITTIIRNLSFTPVNQRLLAEPIVVKFMTGVIRYLGTRNMLLRSQRNTLDFTKDAVIYFSNVAQAIDLPGKEEALCILHFLLSFAPSPPPTTNGDEDVSFAPYNPTVHRYFPPAVDSLAKLLARDDPNRTFYRGIFAAECASMPPHDLLTRTFGLAIAPMPEYRQINLLAIIEARKAYLAQGLLAAEILAGLIPSSEHGLARSWLSSQDGFAPNLVKIVSALAQRVSHERQRNPITGGFYDADFLGYNTITFRGIAVLRKLAEKAKDVEGHVNALPPGILPRKESLLGSLLSPKLDVDVIRQLCNYSVLED